MELNTALNEMFNKTDEKEIIKENYNQEITEDIDIEKITDIEKIKIALDILYNVNNDYYGLSKSIILLTDIVQQGGNYCPFCNEEECECDEDEDENEDYEEDEDEEYDEDEDDDDFEEEDK